MSGPSWHRHFRVSISLRVKSSRSRLSCWKRPCNASLRLNRVSANWKGGNRRVSRPPQRRSNLPSNLQSNPLLRPGPRAPSLANSSLTHRPKRHSLNGSASARGILCASFIAELAVMSLAILASRALHGFQALPVKVEVHVGAGLPAFNIVGLPDTGVRESRERVRSALLSGGFEFPSGRITVNLAPADLPKDSGRFDLAIALGILIASGQLRLPGPLAAGALEVLDRVFVGELSLTGKLRNIKGALAIAMAVARESPGMRLVMPESCAGVAARVPGLVVQSAGTLEQVVRD